MENTSLTVDPRHYHAFQRVPFLLGFFTLKCSICDERLRSLFGKSRFRTVDKLDISSDTDNSEVVKCVACGIYAHRSCLIASMSRGKKDPHMLLKPCEVNRQKVEDAMNQYQHTQCITINDSHPPLQKVENEKSKEVRAPPMAMFHPPAYEKKNSEQISIENPINNADENSDEPNQIWTQNGPPSHWALSNPETLQGLQASKAEKDNIDKDDSEDQSETKISPKERLEQSFTLLSRTLQDNLFAFLDNSSKQNNENNGKVSEQSLGDDQTSGDVELSISNEISSKEETSSIELSQSLMNSHLEVETTKKPDPKAIETASPVKVAYDTFHKIKETRSNLTAATVAGSIAGGVAGLVVAGPAGAYVGMRLGQTFGVLGVVTGGTFNVGVLIVGAAAGYKKASSMHNNSNDKVRMLTIGEEGMKSKMMLVRPNVSVSSHWEEICLEKRREWYESNSKNKSGILGIATRGKSEDDGRKDDKDIVEMEDSEIALPDKIMLLVNRSLNDKNSLPGYMYRELIQEFRARIEGEQDEVDITSETIVFSEDNDDSITIEDEIATEKYEGFRQRRQDTHGVIKYVTATLLDVRPGLAASPVLTEASIAAVESLVFGDLYYEVFEEIKEETREKDKNLTRNINNFFDQNQSQSHRFEDILSPDALRALHMLSEAHSPCDKLAFCVEFLEMLSLKFSSSLESSEQKSMGADSLLKLVCQHIISAKIPNINAETTFLEEFARDEQLLHGKEGYALVTLQAALHFLNSDDNFNSDIFLDVEK